MCPDCAEPVHADDLFCESCGRDLRLDRDATRATASPEPCVRCGTPADGESDYCSGCGLRRNDGTDHVEIDLAVLAGVSDRGLVHRRNEDAMALGKLARGTEVIAAVVCDGVSSVRDPQLASRSAAETTLTGLLGAGSGSGSSDELIRSSVATAAKAVATLAGSSLRDAPSCTLVCGLVERSDDGTAAISVGWVGDSRAYWLSDAGSRLLTHDHSWAAEQIAAGVLDEETAMSAPMAHAITRWIGADGPAEPDVMTFTPQTPGVLLLCTDGLWNYVPDADELAGLTLPTVAEEGPIAAATELTGIAIEAGGRDNITVVVIPVSPDLPRSTA
ncbi:PP2C family serine/threonine-protein phosphatase [Pseudonocardia sp. TRM90224]|uniref:PP2C family serine/threonine-protein phosphatase n=1 Tax=Pseudonocardia sp. TRM90224 TaxID=2812678 RepID=UPI001E283193|nr:PP2C family serine/threonine-protein phosphatase [Pseudonocardia sp. TRM90224]